MIDCTALCTGYPGKIVSEAIDLHVPQGKLVSLIGPNGCGKTTLLKTMAALLPPKSGRLCLAGQDVSALGTRELARLRAYLPQMKRTPNLSVQMLVSHGRFPYLGFSRCMSPEDRAQVKKAMELAGVSQWRDENLKTLSGGQCQRVYLALTIAQDTPLLLWDEPGTYLDIQSRFEMMELARTLCGLGKTIVMIAQDISEALEYSDLICLMDGNGAIRAMAEPGELIHTGVLDDVFSIKTEILKTTDGRCCYHFCRGNSNK